MKRIPILFSAPMVRQILNGQKTKTRRVLTVPWRGSQRALPYAPYWFDGYEEDGSKQLMFCDEYGDYHPAEEVLRCPYGEPGDHLYVKETWQAIHVFIDPETGYGDDLVYPKIIPKDNAAGYWSVVYAATDEQATYHKDDRGFPWRPSIYMPRWASRIELEVVSRHVKLLQDMTSADVLAEGVGPQGLPGFCPPWPDAQHGVPCFAQLWNEINGDRPGCTWEDNPWVWEVEFKRVEVPR